MAGQSNRDRGKEQFWRRTFRQWRRSGLSVRAYCAEHGLAEPSFYAWRRIVAERDQESARVRAPTPWPPARVPDRCFRLRRICSGREPTPDFSDRAVRAGVDAVVAAVGVGLQKAFEV